MMKKSFYETPEAELLLVKFERNILSQENNVNKDYDPDNDLGDIQ
jgi:hypothetical protein